MATPTKTIKIKNRDLNSLLNGLRNLDGRKEVVEVDGNDGQKVKMIDTKPFDLGAQVVYNLAKNMKAVMAAGELLNKALEQVRSRINADADLDDNAKEVKYQDEIAPLLGEEVEIEIVPITFAELNADKNKLQPSTIAEVMVLLED